MAITIRREAVAEIIRRALAGRDHRDVVVDLIDAVFLSDTLDFFEQVVLAKVRKTHISTDWYREYFLNADFDSREIAMNGGLNMKTVTNKRKSAKREIVIEEALEHYDKFIELIDSLSDEEFNIDLSLSLGDATVRLNLNESLVVINALAVRRAAIRGGTWSSAGKQVEAPLMETLCRLFEVEPRYFTRALADDDSLREVDYYLLSPQRDRARCEVKLMGRGNPESADAIHARDTNVFVASTLSDINKQQLDDAGVLWTELQVPNGFIRFQRTLDELGIPYEPREGFSDAEIESAVRKALAL